MAKTKVTVKVEGLSDLEAGLAELPKATGKNVIRRALTSAAQPIVDEATVLIKVRRIQPSIAVSNIKFSSGAGAAGKAAFAEALSRGLSRQEASDLAHQANAAAEGEDSTDITSGVMSIGPTRAAFYGFEFGTIHLPPRPFMRPAWDNHKTEALDIFTEQLKVEIQKAADRIARKQARLIAQIKSS